MSALDETAAVEISVACGCEKARPVIGVHESLAIAVEGAPVLRHPDARSNGEMQIALGSPILRVMTHSLELASETATDRPLWPAMGRGWRRFCPSCGGGPIFDGYLKVRHSCASCGEELFHHRADDIPTWAVLMIVCNLMGIGLLFTEFIFSPPIWVHWALWPALLLPLTLWLLPRVKGSVVGLQWSQRMHGFGGRDIAAPMSRQISGQSPISKP